MQTLRQKSKKSDGAYSDTPALIPQPQMVIDYDSGRAKRLLVLHAVQGEQANLMTVDGNRQAKITDIENVEIVFKGSVGYDSERLPRFQRNAFMARKFVVQP